MERGEAASEGEEVVKCLREGVHEARDDRMMIQFFFFLFLMLVEIEIERSRGFGEENTFLNVV